jgi:hypothetical protein
MLYLRCFILRHYGGITFVVVFCFPLLPLTLIFMQHIFKDLRPKFQILECRVHSFIYLSDEHKLLSVTGESSSVWACVCVCLGIYIFEQYDRIERKLTHFVPGGYPKVLLLVLRTADARISIYPLLR